MIDLGKYVILADANCYSLGEKRLRASDEKNGAWKQGDEYIYPLTMYYSSVHGLLDGLIKKLRRDRIAEGDVLTLKQAAREFRQIENAVREWADIERQRLEEEA